MPSRDPVGPSSPKLDTCLEDVSVIAQKVKTFAESHTVSSRQGWDSDLGLEGLCFHSLFCLSLEKKGTPPVQRPCTCKGPLKSTML